MRVTASAFRTDSVDALLVTVPPSAVACSTDANRTPVLRSSAWRVDAGSTIACPSITSRDEPSARDEASRGRVSSAVKVMRPGPPSFVRRMTIAWSTALANTSRVNTVSSMT